jgi:hypothetical protein
MLELGDELDLPGLKPGRFMGRPSLHIGSRAIVGSKDGRTLVIHCPLEEKDLLLEKRARVYFETPHYRGYPAILARPGALTRRELKLRIERAWAMHATQAARRRAAQRQSAKTKP